jgi:hypothetical protein
VATIVVALAATSGGIAAAQAAPVPIRPTAQHAGVGAVTLPAHVAPRPAARSRAVTNGLASFNWSGYVAVGATYSGVTAAWTQPAVSCTAKGIVTFWVGLDGWQDGTVEQTGTGVDCRTGTPQYYAWWETFPTNSQQTYASTPVSPGDTITASVNVAGGQYALVVADKTQAWTRTTNAAAPTGATNASAEIVAEAASVNKTITQVPDFGTASFTASTIDGESPQAAGAQQTDMVNNSGSVIAKTAAADDNGAFDIGYTGGVGSNVLGAFQAADGSLHTYTATGDTPQKQPMLAGTSPSITALPAGTETAYQGTDSDLELTGPGGTVDTGYGMLAGTSPAITALSGGAFDVAFQANTGVLWVYSSASGTAASLGYGMMAGTDPAIATLSGGAVRVAFQANTGELWTSAATAGSGKSLVLPMAGHSSPAIAAPSAGGYLVAYQSSAGFLTVYPSSTAKAVDAGLGMAAGTSPDIAVSGTGFEAVFQANTNMLWTYLSTSGATDRQLAMLPGTSPSVVAVTGGYETAEQTATGDFMVSGTAGNVDTTQAMLAGTSPDITP